MPNKLTHEFVFNYYAERGYTLLTQYVNTRTKNTLLCPKNHKIEMLFNSFKNGHKCRECSNINKRTDESYVENYYKKRGYTLNSKYKGCMTKDELICPKGHKIEMSFSHFRTRRRCIECHKIKMQYSHDFVFNYYKDHGYTLISEYKGCKNKDELLCPKNHKIEMIFDNFKNNDVRCRECSYENKSGENNVRWMTDRTRQTRTKYLSFDYKKIHILNDDPNYNNHVQSQKLAKTSSNIWDRSDYTVDHIQPRIAFIDNNLDNIYDPAIIKEICNLRENLRIIHEKDNNTKGGKYNQEEFMAWFNEKINEYNTTDTTERSTQCPMPKK
jgi:hypothetical protein